MIDNLEKAIISVIGLGYVGLPLAEAFSKSLKVIGFDASADRINELSRDNTNPNLTFTANPAGISKAEFIIICVPTPVTRSKEPDLSYITGAAGTAGQNLKRGSVVILESTVYPGVTEEIVGPILEKESGLKCGKDFKIAYSPERINPGDKAHVLANVTKVVAGSDNATTELVANLYRKITPHVFKASSIKTAEAAKVIENIQRDLNIALINELALIFEKLGLNTRDVLAAASTKWNFHNYSPGLVGGHCIPVDPYYLVYKAKELGYHPQVILAGRAINDYMPKHIVEMTVKALNNVGKVIKGSRVLIMGLTYKENVPDIRETPTKEIIRELADYGVEVLGHDPLLNDVEREFGINAIANLNNISGIDAVILALVHDEFKKITLDRLKSIMNNFPVLVDVRGFFSDKAASGAGICYRSL